MIFYFIDNIATVGDVESWSIIVEPPRSGLVENYCGSIIADPHLRSGLVEALGRSSGCQQGAMSPLGGRSGSGPPSDQGGVKTPIMSSPVDVTAISEHKHSRIHIWDALCHFLHDADTISRADTADTRY